MAVHMGRQLIELYGELQYEPTAKRVRAFARGRAVVNTRRAVLLWEPKRLVPSYAVPAEDVDGKLVPAAPDTGAEAHPVRTGRNAAPVLDPGTAFAVHTTGRAVDDPVR